ncbi:uncharacterized protein LOC125720605 [Brienomyrus brachyistius]|uniref:uncharacterized protein LOC125720605 n=1 Tax=Brienomyrus brachyistius TaxID=42636 RepID=UPI0020B35B7C|nr:uncharacterized protein LOC125720605 [Brienomyrus brachyistius]
MAATLTSPIINATTVTTAATIMGSALIYIQLEINTTGPVPNDQDILSAAKSLPNPLVLSNMNNLTQPQKIQEITVANMSNNSFVINFGFQIYNMTMSKDVDLRNETHDLIQECVNKLLNAILTDPSAPPAVFPPTNFTDTTNETIARVDYKVQKGNPDSPSSFLSDILKLCAPSTTNSTMAATLTSPIINATSVTTAATTMGSALIYIQLEINTTGPVPNDQDILSIAKSLPNPLVLSNMNNLTQPQKIQEITVANMSNNSFVINFGFQIYNMTMSKDVDLRNETHDLIQECVNKLLNAILTDPSALPAVFPSANFTDTTNETIARVDYKVQKGNPDSPSSFLSDILKLCAPSTTNSTMAATLTSPIINATTVTTAATIMGSALIYIQLEINTTGPVPNDQDILSAAKSLPNPLVLSNMNNLTQPQKIQEITVANMSNNSFVINFGFQIYNMTMSKDVDLRNETHDLIQECVNKLLNAILTDPSAPPAVFPPTNFTDTTNDTIARVDYKVQKGNPDSPSSFLSNILKLCAPSTTNSTMAATLTSPIINATSVTTAATTMGSALIYIQLEINTTGPVPNDQDILSIAKSLPNPLVLSNMNNLTQPQKIQEITVANMSNNSFVINFGFQIYNMTMSKDVDLRNETHDLIQECVNKLLNAILTDPSVPPVVFPPTNFTDTTNDAIARVDYKVQKGNPDSPSSFLSDILKLCAPSTTNSTMAATLTSPIINATTVTTAATTMGSALIYIQLEINTTGPVPNDQDILSIAKSLPNPLVLSNMNNLTQPQKIQEITVANTSNNSFVINFGFQIYNMTMSKDVDLRNETHDLIQECVNKLLNAILTDPSAPPAVFPPANFTDTTNDTIARVDYKVQKGNPDSPSSFLSNILKLCAPSTTNSTMAATLTSPIINATTVTTAATTMGSALIYIQLEINTTGPVPNDQDILSTAKSLPNPLVLSNMNNLTQPQKIQEITVANTSNNSFVINFGFQIYNMTMSKDVDLRNETHDLIQECVNKLLNAILTDPSAPPAVFPPTNFTDTTNETIARVDYKVQKGNPDSPSSFLSDILKLCGPSMTNSTLTTTLPNPTTTMTIVSRPMTNFTTATTTLGSALIFIRLVFITQSLAPSQSAILTIVDKFLSPRLKFASKSPRDPVSIQNAVFEPISSNSFGINFEFKIPQVNMSENYTLRNDTYDEIQTSLDNLLNAILKNPTASHVNFPRALYTSLQNESLILVDFKYVFREGDINNPSSFLAEILKASGLADNNAAITIYPPDQTESLLLTSPGANITPVGGGFPAWALAIIIPCAIFIIPAMILLCCLLGGCCAALQRYWRRRRFSTLQYILHNN